MHEFALFSALDGSSAAYGGMANFACGIVVTQEYVAAIVLACFANAKQLTATFCPPPLSLSFFQHASIKIVTTFAFAVGTTDADPFVCLRFAVADVHIALLKAWTRSPASVAT